MRPGRAALARVAHLILVTLVCLVGCQTPSTGPGASGDALVGAPSTELFVEPDAGTKPVVDFVNSAQQTLDVAMYLLTDRPVISALEAAQKRGVQVRVMLEEHPYEVGAGNNAVYARLRASGVTVAWSPGNFTLSHDKYAIADRHATLIGTANWTAAAFASNREYLVVDDDATDVAQLAAIYDADWNRRSVVINDPHLVISPTNSRSGFIAIIRSAKRQIDLESEEMQDPGIEDALAQAARGGVAVHAILPATSGGDTNAAGRQVLSAAGVQVRQIEHPYMHAKDVVVDGQEAFIGSENFSAPSLDRNREVGILTVDHAAVDRLEQTFNHDWSAAS